MSPGPQDIFIGRADKPSRSASKPKSAAETASSTSVSASVDGHGAVLLYKARAETPPNLTD